MKQVQRALALLTATLMVVNLLPTTALAEELGTTIESPEQVTEDTPNPAEPNEEPSSPEPSTTPESDAPGAPQTPQSPQPPESAPPQENALTEPDAYPSLFSEANTLDAQAPQLLSHDFGEGYGSYQAIPIGSAEELTQISASNPEYPLWGHYFLTNNITLPADFNPIGWGVVREGFTGYFDGCGYSITYRMKADESNDHLALFQAIGSEDQPNALVENLTIKGDIDSTSIFTAVDGAALALENYGLVRQVNVKEFSVTLSGADSNATCLVGTNQPTGIIKLCDIDNASRANASFCAGFAIMNRGTMESCTNNASIGPDVFGENIVTNGAAGITLNMSGGLLKSCNNYGTVSSEGIMETGGIVAQVSGNATLNLCNNHGSVSAYHGDEAAGAGGIAGLVKDTTQITSCVNWAKIESSALTTGGIAGKIGAVTEEHWLIENCENRGTVKGVDKTGGIVGTASTMNYAGRVLYSNNYGDISGGEQVGGIAGENGAVVGYAQNEGRVSGSHKVGGVVGDNGTLGVAEYLLNYGDVTGTGDDVGGVAGYSSAHQLNFKLDIGLSHSLSSAGNYGNVTAGGRRCGGVLGCLSDGSLSVAFNEGDVDGEYDVGGVVGDASDQSVSTCYSTGIVRGSNRVGGIIGDGAGTPTGATMSDALSLGRVEGKPGAVNVGILMGYHSASSSIEHLYHCYYNVDVMEQNMPVFGDGKLNNYDSPVEGLHTSELTGFALQDKLTHNGFLHFTFRANDAQPQLDSVDGRYTTRREFYPQLTEMQEELDCSNPEMYMHDFESQATDGSDDDPVYEPFTYIETADDLQKIANDPEGNFVLRYDITLPDKEDNLPEIATFKGSLDGIGREISNIRSTHGLVGVLERKTLFLAASEVGTGGKLLNLTLSGTIENTGASSLGAFSSVALQHTYQYACVNKVTITGGDNVGGIVGAVVGTKTQSLTVLNCENAGIVTGQDNVGGIIGYGSDDYPLLKSGIISGCVNSGAVQGRNNVGGAAGQTNLVVSGCQNRGAVECTGNVAGGIVGLLTLSSDKQNAAKEGQLGFVQACVNSEDGTVTGNVSTTDAPATLTPGTLVGTGNVVGGIVGKAEGIAHIDAAYSAGNVTGGMHLGGVVGELAGAANLSSCANRGSVNAQGHFATMGGLVGFYASTEDVQTSYNIGTLTAQHNQTERVGGLIGWHNGQGTVRDCYSAGQVEGELSFIDVAAIASMGAGNETKGAQRILNCYYDNEMCILPGVAYGTAGDTGRGLSAYNMTGGGGGDMAFSDTSAWSYQYNGTEQTLPPSQGSMIVQMLNYPSPAELNRRLYDDYGLTTVWPSVITRTLPRYWNAQNETYSGEPMPLTMELPGSPSFTNVRYGTLKPNADVIQNWDEKYTWSSEAPKIPGTYEIKITITEPYYEASDLRLTLNLGKAKCTVIPTSQRVFAGDVATLTFPFTAEGLVNGEDASVLDHVTFGIEGEPTQGEHAIVPVGEFSDDCYELTAGEGTLTIESFYVIEGKEKVTHNGEEWYINGPVTIKPLDDPRVPYDRISDDGGQSWHKEIELNSKHGETFHKTLILKSSTNSVPQSQPFTETINVCSGGFSYDTDPYNLQRNWAPENNYLVYTFSQNVEVLPDAYFEVCVNEELFEKVTADKIVVENNDPSVDPYIAKATIPLSHMLPANAEVTVKNDRGGSFTSIYGATLTPTSLWFTTSLYNGEVVFDENPVVVTYDGKPHGVTCTVQPKNEYVESPHVKIEYESSGTVVYPKTETPPTLPGYYWAWAAIDDPQYEVQAARGGSLNILKKALTLTADNKTMLYGEQIPELTYQAEGLVEGETTVVLDDVSLEVGGEEPLAPGSYEIDFATSEDDCYDITPVAGVLTVKQDAAEGRYSISGSKSGTEDDAWYLGSVTIRPDGRDGYDLISDDNGATWKPELSYTSEDTPKELSLKLLLKKSATGAITSQASTTITLAAAGWTSVVVDNQTRAHLKTSNLLEAIDPSAILVGEDEIAVVKLVVVPIAQENLSANELALLREQAGESTLGQFFSIELFVDVFKKGDPEVHIRNVPLDVTQRPILFSMLFPDDGLTHVNERILRIHDGTVDELQVTVLEDGTRVFSSDKFSTFVTAYDVLDESGEPGVTPSPGISSGEAHNTNVPSTGDTHLPLQVWAIIALVSAGVCGACARRQMKRRL